MAALPQQFDGHPDLARSMCSSARCRPTASRSATMSPVTAASGTCDLRPRPHPGLPRGCARPGLPRSAATASAVDQGAGGALLLRAPGAAGHHDPADPRGRAQMTGRRRFRIWQGLLRPGPVPGPPLHHDRPPHRPGHGRVSGLRRHRRPAARPHRYPGPAADAAWPAASTRPRDDPADRPGDQTPRCTTGQTPPARL